MQINLINMISGNLDFREGSSINAFLQHRHFVVTYYIHRKKDLPNGKFLRPRSDKV